MAEIDGVTVGWLRVTDAGDHVMIEQIYIEPVHQGRGIGSALLRRLVEEWRGSGKALRLAVLKTNPARRLYDRFGFHVEAEKETAWVMRRPPDRS